MGQADIGLWGLAVMGENLVLNMESKGFAVSVFNRTTEKTKVFAENRAKGKRILPFYEVKDFVASLAKPRKIMIMVKAGKAVAAIEGRFHVATSDIRRVAVPTLRHRIVVNFQAQAEGLDSVAVIRRLLDWSSK